MPTDTIENYLKTIYFAEREAPDGAARTQAIARSLSVTPGTATAMLQSLGRGGYLEYTPRRGCTLTPKGKAAAVAVVRKHRLIELFLEKILGLDWGEVHEEAEILEHGVSDKVAERMDRLLGRPEKDPHGQAIPARDGADAPPDDISLAEAASGPYTVSRVSRQDPEFLDACRRAGLLPGRGLRVAAVDRTLGVMDLEVGRSKVALSIDTARFVRVSPARVRRRTRASAGANRD